MSEKTKEKFVVRGQIPLKGEVKISGAKNAALPIIAASLLIKGPFQLSNVPDLLDIKLMANILKELGVEVKKNKETLTLNASLLQGNKVQKQLAGMLRASILTLGPLLIRKGKAIVAFPGGCNIGLRPIDLHLKGLSQMGARFNLKDGYIEAIAEHCLKGTRIYLDFPSVGATENLMLAASLAKGETIIENASCTPEIVDLSNFLNKAGAKIEGAGTRTIRIIGCRELCPVSYSIISDRIEAGTFMIATAITGGELLLKNICPDHLESPINILRNMGVEICINRRSLKVKGGLPLRKITVKTMPYPGFPTDLQPQLTSLACLAEGTSVITETVFENRFSHLSHLVKMGAELTRRGKNIIINGVPFLRSARVTAPDIRGGAALVLAGLAAKGESEILNIFHIDRGHQKLEEKLAGLGAKIKRVKDK